MGKCSRCGRKGLFLKLNSEGLCDSCANGSALERLHRERKKREAEFIEELEALPLSLISSDGPKVEKRSASEIAELKYSNVTSHSDVQRLGHFIAIDTETTGIKATASIIEVSAIRFSDFKPVELFTTLLKPSRAIPESASAVNGITDDMVSNAPRIWEIMPSLTAFIGVQSLVGHNLPFDLQFLYRDGLDLVPKQKFYDTLDLVSRVLKKPVRKWDKDLQTYAVDQEAEYDVEDYKLGTLCTYYDIPLTGAHRSAADCLATGKLFYEIVQAKS